MEKTGCGQVSPSLSRKEKKKKAKDEMDRLKQAEKKRRRLEKALATSAAIRSELEKKKQRKREEQQRLDEEGAAIAESVALHVLGGEDSDESTQIMLNNNRRCHFVDTSRGIGLFMDYQGFKEYTFEGLGWISDAYGTGTDRGIGWSLLPEMHGRHLQVPYFEETGQRTALSAGLTASQAFSALQIADDSYEDPFNAQRTTAVLFNGIMGSNHMENEVNFNEQY